MILKPFVLACFGTSLTTGRLSADWVPTLADELAALPEAAGPVVVYNMGKGSQNSNWGVTEAPKISALKPTHILFEGFAINDCIDTGSGPAVSQAQHIANIETMVAEWQSQIPGVDLTIQTMSSISTVIEPTRPDLAAYYADEVTTGNSLGIRVLDNYAGWPKPLARNLTYIDPTTGLGDGLHPIWTGTVDTYLYPAVVNLVRTQMPIFWGS